MSLPWSRLPWWGSFLPLRRPSRSWWDHSRKRITDQHFFYWFDCTKYLWCLCRELTLSSPMSVTYSGRVSPRFQEPTWNSKGVNCFDHLYLTIIVKTTNLSNLEYIFHLRSLSKSVQVIAVPRMFSHVTSTLISWKREISCEKIDSSEGRRRVDSR